MVFDVPEQYDNNSNDFTTLLPEYLSEEIFSSMDICSVCKSTQVSQNWYCLINESSHVWRNLYKGLYNAEFDNVPRSARHWKVLVEQKYRTQRCKSQWIKGTFAHITSYKDLENTNSKCQFSKDDWGDILQVELAR